MAEELMVEEKSRLTILVIEDNKEFGANALSALKGNVVFLATTLVEAKELAKDIKFDTILSDVHVPERDGMEPEAIVAAITDICLATGTTVCFVTKADHHGILDLGDEGYVSLRATTQGRALMTKMKSSKNNATSEADLFRNLETTESKNIKSGSKTPEIWNKALAMALNAKTKPTSVGRAIRQVGKIGLGVINDGVMPKVIPRK
ncbi:response regulator [Candidatus Micrarchaeota archaeon]|nr:response regulator [Candidatus Micrarchaeota archaeon]MBU1682301.1 response regulator [Candidatus Micrarchaeota archaeon]